MPSIRNHPSRRLRSVRGPFSLGAFSLSLGLVALGYGQGVKMVPLNQPVLPVLQHAQLRGSVSSSQVLNFSVRLVLPQPAALKAYADSVSNPKSANYRQFLTPAQIGQQFGPSADKVQAVVNYLSANGFKITLVPANHFNILAAGTAAQLEKAFNITLSQYHSTDPNEKDRVDFFAFSAPPQVPAAIATYVASIGGLENHTMPHHRDVPLTPGQTRTLYDTAPLYNGGFTGQGRNVAISSWDGFRLSNVPLYYSQFGLPTPAGGVLSNVSVVTVGGGVGSGPAAGEGDIDIQMVLGMAPLCNFTIYDGDPNLGPEAVLTQEANDNIADVISESYGWGLPATDAIASHLEHLALTAQGVTYLNACGDSVTTLLPGDYPDYDGETLAVGGTIATVDATGKRLAEVVWGQLEEGGGAGGGGWSTNSATFNVLPAWQKGTGIPTNLNYRLVPDVSFNAAGATTGAYQFFYNGSLNFDYDGTSFASPMYAGLLAVGEQRAIALGGLKADKNGKQRLGRLQDVIYSQNGRSDVYYDVTSGTNGTLPDGTVSNAGPGWDFASGWGPIDINAFIDSITSTQINVSESPIADPAVFEGTTPVGGKAQLGTVDGAYYYLNSVTVKSLGSAAGATFTFSVPQAASTLTKMSIVLDAVGSKSVTNFVYLLNATTGNYDLINGAPLTGAASSLSFTIQIPANYVSGGKVTALVRQVWPSSLGGNAFTMKLDQALLNYTYAIPNS